MVVVNQKVEARIPFEEPNVFDFELSLRVRLTTQPNLLAQKDSVAGGSGPSSETAHPDECTDRLVVAFFKVPLSESPGTSARLVNGGPHWRRSLAASLLRR